MQEKDSSSSKSRASDLIFLQETTPSVPRGKDAQRIIRSHVTRYQHRQKREASSTEHSCSGRTYTVISTEDHVSANCLQDQRLVPRAGPASSIHGTTLGDSGLPFVNSSHPSHTETANTRKLVRSHVTKWQHRRRKVKVPEVLEPENSTSESSRSTPVPQRPLPPLPESSSEKLISKGAAAIRNIILQDPSNTVATCITGLGFDLRSVMSHYYYMAVEVHAPDFENHYNLKGICERVFLPFLFSDPALTGAIVLIAVVHRMFLFGTRKPTEELLRLKGFVISTINRALESTQRACSDQLIFAVANLAIFEAVFGNRDIYHIHMRGLLRMIDLRGGLPTMGYNGYLEKVLLWYDTNCASLVGCEPYFDRMKFPALPDGMAPDADNFTVGLTCK